MRIKIIDYRPAILKTFGFIILLMLILGKEYSVSAAAIQAVLLFNFEVIARRSVSFLCFDRSPRYQAFLTIIVISIVFSFAALINLMKPDRFDSIHLESLPAQCLVCAVSGLIVIEKSDYWPRGKYQRSNGQIEVFDFQPSFLKTLATMLLLLLLSDFWLPLAELFAKWLPLGTVMLLWWCIGLWGLQLLSILLAYLLTRNQGRQKQSIVASCFLIIPFATYYTARLLSGHPDPKSLFARLVVLWLVCAISSTRFISQSALLKTRKQKYTV